MCAGGGKTRLRGVNSNDLDRGGSLATPECPVLGLARSTFAYRSSMGCLALVFAAAGGLLLWAVPGVGPILAVAWVVGCFLASRAIRSALALVDSDAHGDVLVEPQAVRVTDPRGGTKEHVPPLPTGEPVEPWSPDTRELEVAGEWYRRDHLRELFSPTGASRTSCTGSATSPSPKTCPRSAPAPVPPSWPPCATSPSACTAWPKRPTSPPPHGVSADTPPGTPPRRTTGPWPMPEPWGCRGQV